ncbi:MAG TPA: hypothetical protein VGK49_07085 [Ilumatobacteraceae bacterium]
MNEPKRPARRKPPPASPWCDASIDISSLDADELLAHELVVRRRDLTPSVERIMNMGGTPAVRCRALTAFREALDNPGDPNRDPRVAIASANAEAT